jgi:hypothetical protein
MDTSRRSSDDRQDALARAVQGEVMQGARVESQTGFSAVLVRGRRVNHVLHLLLSIFTVGLWVIVWIILSLSGGEKRKMITVDEYGNIASQPLGGGGFHPGMAVGIIILVIFVFYLVGRT